MTLTLYSLLLRLALPLVLARLYWRSRKAPAYRQRIAERLACGSAAPPAAIWLHAVSVGEVQAAEPLLRRLLSELPGVRILVTTTTPTGAAHLAARLGDALVHRYTPYDLPGITARFLSQARPALVILMETEIWPNSIALCARRGIPVVLANARLSARSAHGYGRLARLTRETLGRLSLIAAQSAADAERFCALGAAAERVTVTGSLKFDLTLDGGLAARARRLRAAWGAARPVWVAASTHAGEEVQVLAAHRQLVARLPDALLVLVPRHPERFAEVAALVERAGFGLARRSRDAGCAPGTAVVLGDTMGELQTFLAAADVAFIGGSLVPTGGHNLLEAAAVGVPILVGPHTFNFATITALFVAEGAAQRVADAAELAAWLVRWLEDAAARQSSGERGRALLERHRGALDRLLERLRPWLATLAESAPPSS